jgi:hypothetical protein
LPLALGVMWMPVTAKHRKTQPKQVTRRHRRSGPLLRRSGRGGQHAALCGGPPARRTAPHSAHSGAISLIATSPAGYCLP